ncbi:PRAME family member 12-like [Ctenodactylus gundi]
MSTKALPTLQELATRSLLRLETVTSAALEDLPPHIIPELFMDAFLGAECKILKAIVPTWPLPCLPLGSLLNMKKTDISQTEWKMDQTAKRTLGAVEAVLAGLDELLAQNWCSRRCKLQVLDMRDLQEKLWSTGSAPLPGAWLSAVKRSQRVEACPGMELKKPLKVIPDVDNLDPFMSKICMCVLEWVQKRKQQIHFCHQRLPFLPTDTWWMLLNLLNLTCVQEVKVYGFYVEMLEEFAPYLGLMRNLKTLGFLTSDTSYSSSERQMKGRSEFTGHLRRLGHLRDLYVWDACFLRGHVKDMFRCLEVPLVTLSIINCELSESDWKHLCRWPSLHQLRDLDLRGVILTQFSPEPLRLLMERVATTLATLDLQKCRITDTHLSAILPALSRCSQLTTLSLFDNDFSMALLKDLLGHTASLSRLSLELYPAPAESYDDFGDFQGERFTHVFTELTDTLRVRKQPKVVMFAAYCRRCQQHLLCHLESLPVGCWESHCRCDHF